MKPWPMNTVKWNDPRVQVQHYVVDVDNQGELCHFLCGDCYLSANVVASIHLPTHKRCEDKLMAVASALSVGFQALARKATTVLIKWEPGNLDQPLPPKQGKNVQHPFIPGKPWGEARGFGQMRYVSFGKIGFLEGRLSKGDDWDIVQAYRQHEAQPTVPEAIEVWNQWSRAVAAGIKL